MDTLYYVAAEHRSKTVSMQVAILLSWADKTATDNLIALVLRSMVKTLPVTLSKPNLQVTAIPGESSF